MILQFQRCIGEDPSRLSVVFDEVTVKDRIVVEGGEGKNALSQFDGPVTFSQNVRFKEDVTFTDQVKSNLEMV